MPVLFMLVVLLILPATTGAELVIERKLESGPGFDDYLVSYTSDGLKVHALVAVPDRDMPEAGFPVVIANHGYVPDPRRYGITAEGLDARPGDYYRSVPGLYASRGFLVVMPDYRGHNNSEGYDQIQGANAESIPLYARDVVALIALIGEIDEADLGKVFLWSHSMGGAVSLRAQLETDLIVAASYWSTMPLDDLDDRLGVLDTPIMIQHGTRDESTRYRNSLEFRGALRRVGIDPEFHAYDTADHFFRAEIQQLAADRDAAFFRSAASD